MSHVNIIAHILYGYLMFFLGLLLYTHRTLPNLTVSSLMGANDSLSSHYVSLVSQSRILEKLA